MYHAFVRRQIRHGYELINAGQFSDLVAHFAQDALFSFAGDHVLGGEFRGPEAVRAWFEELRRLFPDFRLARIFRGLSLGAVCRYAKVPVLQGIIGLV